MAYQTKLPGSSQVRRDRLLREHIHDTYKMRSKLPEPTACGECGAVFRKGRWEWSSPPPDAHTTLCPACHRVRDKCPAGYLTLSGAFLRDHRDDILHLARNVETREKTAHPLRRVMEIEDADTRTVITTTDMGLARDIGEAIHSAYKGELDYQYTDEANILEVKWSR
jgi:hypothetical protein